MQKIPLNFPLYENTYNEFPCEQYFITLFDCLPSRISSRKEYSDKIIDYFKEIGFLEECRSTAAKRYMEKSQEIMFIHVQKQIIIKTRSNLAKDSHLLTFDVYFNIKNGDAFDQLDLSTIKKYLKEYKKSNIQLVRSDMGHLDTEEYDLPIPDIDLELNYGNDFLKIHNTIIKRLNTEHDKGIILLHGEPGTGKTTYLKYLTGQIKNKSVLFIPPSMAEILSEPSIIPFLMDNRNSILLIEDAERVIGDRDSKGSPAGVSNLLNLTDGILGDCLNIQVIATFNMKRERIDSALLRKGRLICEHKFEKLSIDSTNILLKHLNKNITVTEPLTLADIYNIDGDSTRITKDAKKMGF